MFRLRALPSIGRILAIAALSALGACGDRTPTAPTDPRATGSLLGSSEPKLVECPTDETKTKTLEILDVSIENILSIDGTSVLFPPFSLDDPTTVTLTIPASKYVEIAIQTSGQYKFDLIKPIVTISYARCNRFDVLLKPLTAWYIDAEKEPKEKMDGIDNKLTRSVTFPADHFSGYAIAF
jgi:hypothetical protein